MENMNLTQICESISNPKILIQTFKSFGECVNLQDTLENLKPTFIVMYHCSMTCVREIEVKIGARLSCICLFFPVLDVCGAQSKGHSVKSVFLGPRGHRRRAKLFDHFEERKRSLRIFNRNQIGKN